MSADDLKAQLHAWLGPRFIAREHALYLQTGNPIHAWRAYATTRKLSIATPDWVLTYFDACADVLTTRKYSSAKAIADALGLGTRGGRLVTRQADTNERNLAIVARIEQLKQRPSRNELKALADAHGLKGEPVDRGDRTLLAILTQVAEEYCLDVNQVQAVYYKMIRPPTRLAKRP